MKSIKQGELKITGFVESKHINQMMIQSIPNMHAVAKVTAVLEKQVWEEKRKEKQKENEYIEIWGNQIVLFHGIINNIHGTIDGEFVLLHIELNSTSILLDQKRKKRSYQDINETLSDIIQDSLRSELDCKAVFNTNSSGITMPVIQYRETDWEFAKRMTSRLYSVIYPDITSSKPRIFIGMHGGAKKKIEASTYAIHLSKDYYSEEYRECLKNKRNFIFYRVETYENLELGEEVIFQDETLRICKKSAITKNAEVIFIYDLGYQQMICLNRYDNDFFAGLTILGTVLETSNETLKLHLDIDKEQDKAKAYDYQWTPETGNTMYCMPKLGTKICLYFGSEKEESALATSTIRENSSTCPKVNNVNDRYLTTENNKQMFLKPDSIGFESEETGMSIKCWDAKEINFSNKKNMLIVASNKICIKAKQIEMDTPTEINILRG